MICASRSLRRYQEPRLIFPATWHAYKGFTDPIPWKMGVSVLNSHGNESCELKWCTVELSGYCLLKTENSNLLQAISAIRHFVVYHLNGVSRIQEDVMKGTRRLWSKYLSPSTVLRAKFWHETFLVIACLLYSYISPTCLDL